jgi:hypothetical protein
MHGPKNIKFREVVSSHCDSSVFSEQHLNIYLSVISFVDAVNLAVLDRSIACRCELASTGNTEGALCD